MVQNENIILSSLITSLDEIIIIINNFEGEYLHHYYSPIEFNKEIIETTKNLKENNFEDLNDIYNSFHPNSEFYDLINSKGKELGLQIFHLTELLIKSFNSSDILELIDDFIKTAELGVSIFKKLYNVTNLLEGWHQGIYDQTGKLVSEGIEYYAFHGCGLALNFKNKKIDFDFVGTKNPKHNGFDLWRLSLFANGQPIKYSKYLDIQTLEKDFNFLIASKKIYIPYQENSPKQYFLKSDNH